MQRIFSAIQSLLETKDNIIVAIEGRSASGKTQVAKFIQSKIDCNVFCMDDFVFLTNNVMKKNVALPM